MSDIKLHPKYNKMLLARINAVKYTYSEYKIAMKEYLDHSWIKDNGKLDFYRSYDIIVKEKLEKYENAKKDLEEFRTFINVLQMINEENNDDRN